MIKSAPATAQSSSSGARSRAPERAAFDGQTLEEDARAVAHTHDDRGAPARRGSVAPASGRGVQNVHDEIGERQETALTGS